ncbi:erythromycin esterase family protein [Chondromyces crocatus]|nr:erythromycin esterase family protein [Chondromyces crocatus]
MARGMLGVVLGGLPLGCAGVSLDRAWVERTQLAWGSPESTVLGADVEAKLDAMLEGKRIVFLGEPDHYIHEKYPYRLAMLRHLVKRGFLHVGMEIGTSEGRRIDRFFETGDPRALDRVVLWGYAGDSPEERRELERFLPRAAPDQEAARAFVAEERRFFIALRALVDARAGAEGAGPRLHFFGFDTDTPPGGAYQDLRETLKEVADTPEGEEALHQLALVPGEDLSQEALRVFTLAEAVQAELPLYVSAFGQARATQFQEQVVALAESLVWVVAQIQAPTLAARRRFLDRRERFMHAQLDRWLAQHPKEKLVLLGHNAHLSRASEKLRMGLPDGEHAPMWRSVGTHVVGKRPADVLAVWLLGGEGRHFLPDGKHPVVREVPLRSGSVEAALAPFGDAFLLDLRERPPGTLLDAVVPFGHPGSHGHGPVGLNADALVFFRRVSPPRP